MNYAEGKWMIKGNRIYCDIDADKARLIATIGGTDEEAKANAQLIAAAPDMYEACKTALEFFVQYDIENKVISGISTELNKALSKAEGK